MGLVLRTLRNKWFRDSFDGVQTKIVDDENEDTDSIDLTDELEENQAITPSWDDVSGPTLGTPSVSGGVVTYTHKGVGSAVLVALLDFVAYLASLINTETGVVHMEMHTLGGTGGVSGDAALLWLDDVGMTGPFGAYEGKEVKYVNASGQEMRCLLGTYDAVTKTYDVTLEATFPAADESVNMASYNDNELTFYDDIDEYEEYAAKKTRTLRFPLRFVDPTNVDEDDYTP